MSRRTGVIAIALSAALLVGVAGCGEEHESEVVEGEPLELGELEYNVQITRFLNPDDRQDAEYVEGQKLPPPPGQTYLAVFTEVDNRGEEDATLPAAKDVHVIDTTHETSGVSYEPLPDTNIFMLDLGATIGAGEKLPADDTAAAAGPTQGSILLFLVPEDIGANRPLELEFLDGEEVEGKIELDI